MPLQECDKKKHPSPCKKSQKLASVHIDTCNKPKTPIHMPHRKSIRLDGYNYSYPGYYFITINAHQRRRRFGYIRHGVMHESTQKWNFGVDDEDYRLARRSKIIPALVGRLKMLSSKRIHEQYDDASPVWQRNYYDRLIPNEEILRRTRLYILNNPLHWCK